MSTDIQSRFVCEFCEKECKNENSLRNHSRLCKKNPNRQLPFNGLKQYNEFRKLNGIPAWNKGLTKDTDDRVLKISTTLKKKFADGETIGTFGLHGNANIMNRTDVKEKHRQSMRKVYSEIPPVVCGRGKHGWYNNIWCDSTWELAYIIYATDHNINFVRNKTAFQYTANDGEHSYYPDFYLPDIDTYLEIKGYETDRVQIKIEQFPHKLLIYRESEMQPILEYAHNKYGNNLEILYDDR